MIQKPTLLVLALFACGFAAHAEDGMILPLATGDPATRATLPCTLDQVLYTALKNNATLEIARLDPDIAETGIVEAKGVFDPTLSGSATIDGDHRTVTEVNTTAASIPTGFGAVADNLVALDRALNAYLGPREDIINTHASNTALGVQELFTTGTQISLQGNISGATSDLTEDAYDAGATLSIRQPLLRGFGRRIGTITIRQAQNQAAQSLQNFAATMLTTLRQTEVAYWDLVLAREVLGIREFGVTLAKEQYDRSDARYNVGKGLQADVLAARAELATRQADLSDAQADIHARTVSLLELIKPEGREAWAFDLEPEAAPGAEEEVLDENAAVDTALARRPELLQARLEIERQALDVRQRKNDLLPDLDVVASYGRRGEARTYGGSADGLGSSSLDNYSVGIEFQTSLSKRSEKARLQRARLNATQAERFLRRDEDSVAAEVRQAVIAARKRWERIAAVRQAVQAREEELEIERGRNLAGKTTTLDVLQVQRDLLQAQFDEANARIGYRQALATLYAAEGTLLDRRGIMVETEAD